MTKTKFHRVKEVAELLSCGVSTVHYWVKQGKLNPPTKLSEKVAVWSDEDIQEFIERAKGGAQ